MNARSCYVALALCGALLPVHAEGLEIFKDADLPAGEKLIKERGCDQCHAARVGGDGSAIYRPKGRINTPAALRTMVDYCNTQGNMQLFPDEVTAIAAVLQRDHYHFK